MLPVLTLEKLKTEVPYFLRNLYGKAIPQLYGSNDGKAVGTYIEHKFRTELAEKYSFSIGNSASGIDFPELLVDLKVTSIKQPQSSCPYRDAAQKIYGLGYHLIVLVYEKIDHQAEKVSFMNFLNAVFIRSQETGDYQTTRGIREIIERNGNLDDVVSFLIERNLPVDEIGAQTLAERILKEPPVQGYLTISNALQWRLQYQRILAISQANDVEGVENLLIV